MNQIPNPAVKRPSIRTEVDSLDDALQRLSAHIDELETSLEALLTPEPPTPVEHAPGSNPTALGLASPMGSRLESLTRAADSMARRVRSLRNRLDL